MKHLIMGTAGHVDHGKTALAKALTGFDCDTHKEEKTRGITINLGFTHLDLPNGESLGIVDVPGHRDFVHTMVGGATGIDMALLVVAADSGVMPQTIEHVQIMDVLGIRAGFVALTKIDLADPEIVELAEEEVRELVDNTFLKDCSIVRVSSFTGEGLDSLVQAISNTAATLEDRHTGEVFRLFPDRVFTKSGFGTIVTGSVIGGALALEDTVFLLPGQQRYRVRHLQRHEADVDRVVAGDRAAINLAGLKREAFKRGMVIADRVLPATAMVDAQLRLFPHSRDFTLWTQVVFHFGTYEHEARVHLMDRDRLAGGETGLAQIHLDEPCIAQYGDRFVVRSTSNDITLGGGEIIDPTPLHHRRRTAWAVDGMARMATGEMPELIAAEIRKRFRPVTHVEIADIINAPLEEVREVVLGDLPEDVIRYITEDTLILIVKREHDRLQSACLKSIAAYHRRHPLDKGGRTVKELTSNLMMARGPVAERFMELMLHKLREHGEVKPVGKTWAIATHTAAVTTQMAKKIRFVDTLLISIGCNCLSSRNLRMPPVRRRLTDAN